MDVKLKEILLENLERISTGEFVDDGTTYKLTRQGMQSIAILLIDAINQSQEVTPCLPE